MRKRGRYICSIILCTSVLLSTTPAFAEDVINYVATDLDTGELQVSDEIEIDGPAENIDACDEIEIEIETEESATAEGLPDQDELFACYVESRFYGDQGLSLFSSSYCGDKLTGQNRKLYEAMTDQVKKIAAGEVSFTQFLLDGSSVMDKNIFYAEELGVETITADNARALAKEQLTYNLVILLDALVNDMPYEMFWFDKGTGGLKMSYTIGYTSTRLTIKQFKIGFTVAQDYRGDSSLTVDTEKLQSVGTAVDNAKALIDAADEMSDLEKILFYKDSICDLTVYNYEAASSSYEGGYGNPWQIIYVFDEDPETNVVCEGYAKAFQYLMDETAFSSAEIVSYIITGKMNGGNHMWNVLHMDNDENYLVDLTANDNFRNANTVLRFMELTDSGDTEEGYRFDSRYITQDGGQRWITAASYIYDSDTRALYTEEELSLSDVVYPGLKDLYLKPEILSQPQNISAKAKDKVTFDVTAQDVLTYQWQYSKDGLKWYKSTASGSGTNILSLTTSTGNASNYYRCKMQGLNDQVIYSDIVHIDLLQRAKIVTQPETVTASIGDLASFQVEALHVSAYQWQYSKDGQRWYKSSLTGADTSRVVLKVNSSNKNNYYRCKLTGTDGSVTYTERVRIIE